ncbi:hypothetical protein D0437_27420 [Bacillus cereus]|uniref:Secreted protein n=1 Tax=Bacillus cereus TaxID=1396 RepID=A0A9X7M0S2_BACCE|nr:hypothetical protein D0437_27420 [Bacillus cereus]
MFPFSSSKGKSALACCSPFPLVFSSGFSISSGGAISCKNSSIPCAISFKSASFCFSCSSSISIEESLFSTCSYK